MLQVTDRLLGSSPEEAARVVGAVSRRATLALALHDLPQPAEGGSWYRRRRDAYADMTDAADVVVVASEHERDCLDRCRREAAVAPLPAGRVVVVPLPIEPGSDQAPPRGVQETEVAVLGYLYPGKGVDEVVAAAARLRRAGRSVRVTCLGAPAEGHAEHAAELVAGARRAGVPFRVTGFVPEAELDVTTADRGRAGGTAPAHLRIGNDQRLARGRPTPDHPPQPVRARARRSAAAGSEPGGRPRDRHHRRSRPARPDVAGLGRRAGSVDP